MWMQYSLYQMAKKLLGKQRKALQVLERSAEHHQITDSQYRHGRKQIQAAGVYPYAFIRKRDKLEMLANPLKLIWDKLVAIGVIAEPVEHTIGSSVVNV